MSQKNRSQGNEAKDNVVDDVDTTAPQPVQDEPQQPAASETADGERGDVIGRRNESLPLDVPSQV